MTEHLGAPEHEPAAGTPDCAPAVPAGALILREEAFARGVNADDIRRRLERGQWIALRPGAYLRSSTDRALTARESGTCCRSRR